MPLVKPFSALIPAAHLQSSVVTRPLEYYSTGEAKLIASENNYSFLHLINPALDHAYLRDMNQSLIFRKIAENFNTFVNGKVLVDLNRPCYYIYQLNYNGITQTGLWTLSDVQSYLNGSIKKHELTVERREKQLADYLHHTGLDANPVLITYHPVEAIELVTQKYIKELPVIDFVFTDLTGHKVWLIDDQADIDLITNEIGKIESVYIADGHHRAAAMSKMDFFSTVFMNTKEIRVLQFNRLVRDLHGLSPEDFLSRLGEAFTIEKSDRPVDPDQLHQIGMYLNFQWYILCPKPGIYDADDPVELLDVSILQNHLLGPVLGIDDPRTNARITFEGGITPLSEIQTMVDNGLYAIAFTLFAVSVEQIINVADANKTMPPKSTWIEPKFLVGILTNYCMHEEEY
ncbi:uncharacterized protein (DUF1015 family) [Pedobacter cryoconitis]|uniref:Uncharacterized protein (DUF1015 family) n=1 Tax=Pedobacter cryoconitis TaxID=188932 RepID=A0A7W8ZNG0_9SPHI|nr:DUF1015 family protein [Pedobacter cryoconitis]MBB5637007.1 uncharacterized protein (DUF1015 family) [Pedobacter cryoconitis]